MSQNNQPLSNNTIIPLQRVSLNSTLTSLILDSDTGDSSFTVRTGSTNAFYIDKFANVGINTSSPNTQLEIVSTNGSCLRIRHSTASTTFANLFMTNTGNLSISTNAVNSEIVISSPLNCTSQLRLNGTAITATAEQLNTTNVTAGTATASRALVLDSSLNINGINSVGLTSLNVDGSVFNKTMTDYLTNITIGTGSANKAIILDSDKNITGINSLSATSIVVNGLDVSSAISSSVYTVDITPGLASASKALVVNSNKDITGINSMSMTTLNLGLVALTETHASYIAGITAGTATNNKALVLNGSGSISGISSIGTTSITVGGVSIGSTELGYITGVTIGSATSGKVLIPDSNRDLTNLRSVSLSGTNDLLSLSNSSTSGYVAQTFSSDMFALSVGVRGSTNSANPNTAYLHYNGGYRLLINSIGEVSIGTNTFGHRLNVSGSVNATTYSLAGTQIDFTGLSFVNGVTAGTAANNKALVMNGSGSISGISSLSTTSLIINGTTLTSTEANYLTGITAGTAAAGKALIPNSNRDITNLRAVSLSGTNDLLTLSNNSASGHVAQTFTSDTLSLSMGVRGSTNATNPSTAYWFFNNAFRMLMNSSGEVSIGTNTFGHRLNVSGSVNATTYSLAGTQIDFTGLSFVNGVVAGTAANSKALVLNGSGSISGITSIGTTSININGVVLGSTQAGYISGITVGVAANSKALVLSETGTISGINSLTTNAITIDNTILTSTEAGYISGITVGSAANGKALVLNGSGEITGITSLSTDTLILGGRTLTSTEANYLTGITTGTATASKALVVDAARQIANISRISLSPATGVSHQIDITNTATNGLANMRLTTDQMVWEIGARGSTQTNPNEFYISGGLTASQGLRLRINPTGFVGINAAPNATHRLAVGGSINATDYAINGTIANIGALTDITLGTPQANKALTLDANSQITGGINLTGTITSSFAQNRDIVFCSNGSSSFSIQSMVNGEFRFNTLGANANFHFRSGGTSRLIILTNGNVGINNSSPAHRLAVGGSIDATDYAINGTIANIGTLTDITLGTAAASKALVVNADRNIDNINTLTATSLAGTLSTASQPNITSVGTLTSLNISGNTVISSITDATSATDGGALTISGGLAVAKKAYVGEDLHVTGTIFMNGSALSSNSYLEGITEGVASASKALVVDDSRNISNINTLTATSLAGTLTTSSQSNITSVGTLTTLNVSGATQLQGATNITNTTSSTSATTGALRVTGGVGISGALNIAGAFRTTNTTASTNPSTGSISTAGGIGATGSINAGSWIAGRLGNTGNVPSIIGNWASPNYWGMGYNGRGNTVYLGTVDGSAQTPTGTWTDARANLDLNTIFVWGSVSIGGGTSPNYPLDIFDTVTTTFSSARGLLQSTGASTRSDTVTGISVCIRAQGWVWSTAGGFVVTSDRRLKTDIEDIHINEAIKLLDIKPVYYNNRTSSEEGRQIGLIAQDLIKADICGLVKVVDNKDLKEHIDEDGFKSPENIQFTVSYDRLGVYLLKLVKDLYSKNESLEQQLQETRQENETMKNELAEIKAMLHQLMKQ